MDKEKTLQQIKKLGLLAVIRGPSPELTVKLVAALVAGGVTGIEITFTTPNALQVVAELDRLHGENILLGMGTLTLSGQAAAAQAAGARFLVSPHTEAALAGEMTATGLPVMIGALTPSEIVQASRLGSDVVKLFPGSLGGPAYLKALRGPYPDIPLMPTGGVSSDNLAAWFAAGAYAVGAGSELCPPKMVVEERFDEINANARAYVSAVAAARDREVRS